MLVLAARSVCKKVWIGRFLSDAVSRETYEAPLWLIVLWKPGLMKMKAGQFLSWQMHTCFRGLFVHINICSMCANFWLTMASTLVLLAGIHKSTFLFLISTWVNWSSHICVKFFSGYEICSFKWSRCMAIKTLVYIPCRTLTTESIRSQSIFTIVANTSNLFTYIKLMINRFNVVWLHVHICPF